MYKSEYDLVWWITQNYNPKWKYLVNISFYYISLLDLRIGKEVSHKNINHN